MKQFDPIDLIEAIGDIDPKMVEKAYNTKKRIPAWLRYGSLAACIAALIALACFSFLRLSDQKHGKNNTLSPASSQEQSAEVTPAEGSASDEERPTTGSGSCGANVTWTLDDEGTLTISGTGPMEDYQEDDGDTALENLEPWVTMALSVKALKIEDGITSIGANSFSDLWMLSEDVVIPDSVTSIGEGAFKMSNITGITIPESVTSIGEKAFAYCRGLTAITIPSGVTALGYGTFAECEDLSSVTFAGSITSFGDYTFANCTSLTDITLPAGITEIPHEMFSGCSSLRSVTLPEGVTGIGEGAFYGCSSLTGITLPTTVTEIGMNAFENCTGLTGITIPEGVTSIGDTAFYGCTGLTSLSLPASLTTIGSSFFSNCSSLQTISYGGTTAQWAAIPAVAYQYTGLPDGAVIQCSDGTTAAADTTTDYYTAAAGVLTVATSAYNPPYEYFDGENMNIIGIDAEIAQAIADRLGLQLKLADVEYEDLTTYVSCMAYDMGIAALTVNSDRLDHVILSAVYATNVQVVLVSAGSDIASPDDLAGRQIGVAMGTSGDLSAASDFGTDYVTEYDSPSAAVDALLAGEVEAVILDQSPAESYAADNEGLTILDTPYLSEEYAVCVSQENEALMDAVNGAIEELLADGTIQAILDKYITG